jgi:hypothetical protein
MSKASKVADAMKILGAIGIPVETLPPRRRERLALALLATANMKPADRWEKACVWEGPNSWAVGTREIITFWNTHYGQKLSSGSYDDVRRQELALLCLAKVVNRSVANPGASINDATRKYAVAAAAAQVLRSFGKPEWNANVNKYRKTFGVLSDRLERKRTTEKVPVHLPDGVLVELSSGPHNILQKAIVEEFLPRFARKAAVLYLGDAQKKILVNEEAKLKALGFPEFAHGMLPDVVAYDSEHNWIFLIEAVHSANPISKIRHLMLEDFTANCKAPLVYVSVFKDRAAFAKWIKEISWETEVWLADSPDNMIHFNGDKFLGPHAKK